MQFPPPQRTAAKQQHSSLCQGPCRRATCRGWCALDKQLYAESAMLTTMPSCQDSSGTTRQFCHFHAVPACDARLIEQGPVCVQSAPAVDTYLPSLKQRVRGGAADRHRLCVGDKTSMLRVVQRAGTAGVVIAINQHARSHTTHPQLLYTAPTATAGVVRDLPHSLRVVARVVRPEHLDSATDSATALAVVRDRQGKLIRAGSVDDLVQS